MKFSKNVLGLVAILVIALITTGCFSFLRGDSEVVGDPVVESFVSIADTYIIGDWRSNENFGEKENLELKLDALDSENNSHRKAFLKFNIGEWSEITSATLKLFAEQADSPDVLDIRAIAVYDVTKEEGWDETVLTWNNASAGLLNGGTFINEFSVSGPDVEAEDGRWYEVDVTELVKNYALDSIEEISLRLESLTPHYALQVYFTSREGAEANRPTLVIEDDPLDDGSTRVVIDGYDITASLSEKPLKDIYQADFMMGVGLNGYNIATDTTSSPVMNELIKHHFNSVTYTNLMKPSYILDQGGSRNNYNNGSEKPAVNFSSVIQGLDFCQANDIKMRGHTLVWHAQTPDWFFREGYANNGDYVDRETMLFRMESYIEQVLEFVQENYPGVIYAWDVVNEAITNERNYFETDTGFQIRTKYGEQENPLDNPWYVTVGVDYPEKAFEYARKYADPEVKLFYNDYNTFQPDRTAAIYRLASHLMENDLIDGIGMQGHMGLGYPGIHSGYQNWKTALEQFGKLGLEIHITELTVNIDGNGNDDPFLKQAQRYGDLFRLFSEMDAESQHGANITSVTIFGLMDNYLLYDNDTQTSRLFDGELQPKPAFDAVARPSRY